jgi:putative FmdB family regulatory protein
MPTYEYICEKCGHEFEMLQSISAKSLRTCPEGLCGQKKWGHGHVKRKIGAGGGLLFKGSGFYITDYRSAGYNEAAKKESAPAKTSGSENKSVKSETKSVPAKSETKTK